MSREHLSPTQRTSLLQIQEGRSLEAWGAARTRFRAPPWAVLCRRAGRPHALGLHCFLLLPDQNITCPTSTLASFLGHRKKTILGGPVCTSPHQVETKVLTCHARGPLSLIIQPPTGSLSLWSSSLSTSLSLNCS